MPIRAVLLASLVTLAQGATVLRWTPREGDVVTTRTVATIRVIGTEATLASVMTQKVIRVDPDGGYLVQATPTEGKVTMGGQELPTGNITVLTNYGPNGEIREIRSEGMDAAGYRMANLTNFHAPVKAVAVGDSWTAEGKADAKTGTVPWKADYKVVAEEPKDGIPSLKMEVTARETEGSDAGKATGFVWVGKDGVVVRSELDWTNVAVPGAPGPVNGRIVQSLVSKESVPAVPQTP